MATAPRELTPKKRICAPRFLKHFGRSGNIRAACEVAGIDRHTYYTWRREDPEFDRACEHAHEDALDSLEEVGWERARESSDLLLMFFLKAGRPAQYRERSQIDVYAKMTREELLAVIVATAPQLTAGEPEEGGEEAPPPVAG
jgi:hypothetical protein